MQAETQTMPGPRSRRVEMLAAFADAGYLRVEPPLLHDSATFLDLGGEDIRARLFFTSDANGAELCLRPEYSIPVARLYLASPEGRAAGRLQLWRPGVPDAAGRVRRIHPGRARKLRPHRHRGGGCRSSGARA